MCRRQDVSAHYLAREKLQSLLERKFPRHPGLNFHIRVGGFRPMSANAALLMPALAWSQLCENVWSFDAPEEVSEEELE
ncbi:hypothetical protein BDV12DRAFT_203011 [Aspergillus spectabilis]